MDKTVVEAIGQKMVGAVRDAVKRATEPLEVRIAELQAREPLKGDKGDKGDAGKDFDPATLTPHLEALKHAASEAEEGLRKAVQEAIASVPAPAKGDKGDKGDAGTSVTLEQVLPIVEAAFAKWALEFERRASDALKQAIDRIPVPKDGVDGLSIEDLAVEDDGDGLVTLRFSRGEVSREFQIRLPRFKDCGVFKEGEAYRTGDSVSYGGSLWIAQKDAPEGKPDSGSGSWRLAVKRGRDARPIEQPIKSGPVKLR